MPVSEREEIQPGQVSQRKELQMRKVQGAAPSLYRLFAKVQFHAWKGEDMLCGGRLHDLDSRLLRQEILELVQELFLAICNG